MNSFEHICEVCNRHEVLTPRAAYDAGWDYPPYMGVWGVISPRTCPTCGMDETLWWAIQIAGVDAVDHSSWPERHRATLERILAETPQA